MLPDNVAVAPSCAEPVKLMSRKPEAVNPAGVEPETLRPQNRTTVRFAETEPSVKTS